MAQKYADAVIVCDDGSADLTALIAHRLGADVIKHKENRGYGAALKSLFLRARRLGADILVTLNADGYDDPSMIPVVVKPIVDKTADLVIGSRFIDNQGSEEMPFYRRIGAKVITKLVDGISKLNITDTQSGFRAYSRNALQQLSLVQNGMGASIEIINKAKKGNFNILEVGILKPTEPFNVEVEIDSLRKLPSGSCIIPSQSKTTPKITICKDKNRVKIFKIEAP